MEATSIYIGIDTGTRQSAIVALENRVILAHKLIPNAEVISQVRTLARKQDYWKSLLAIEMFEGRGQVAGQECYDSIFMAGMIAQAWIECGMIKPVMIYRREVKASVCGDSRASDANIRRAVLDEFKPMGGGATPQVGTKKQPGPLYGISKDKWSALAIALTAQRGQYGKVRIKL